MTFTVPVYAGTTFEGLSTTTNVIKVKNSKEMDRIIELIRVARAKSARALSKEEIEKILKQAEETKDHQVENIVDTGAMVFAGSQIVK